MLHNWHKLESNILLVVILKLGESGIHLSSQIETCLPFPILNLNLGNKASLTLSKLDHPQEGRASILAVKKNEWGK